MSVHALGGYTSRSSWARAATLAVCALVLSISLAACQPTPAYAPAGAPAQPTAAPARGGFVEGAPAATPIAHLIVREGTLTLIVLDTRTAQAAIRQIVAGYESAGGFVVSSTEYGGETGAPSIDMVIRVPAIEFDSVMTRLAALAVEVRDRRETADDVTEEYVDAQARLESLEAARDRLKTIMANATNTKDLLDAEQQLTQREAEIEALQGRMQFLEQSARLSKISISLQPYTPAAYEAGDWGLGKVARDAFDALTNSVRDAARFLVYFVIAILPWLVVFGLIVYGVVRLTRRRGPAAPKKSGGEPPPPPADQTP